MAVNNARGISAVEFTLGALIVIGHNVYHVVPNEVPILFVLGLISLRARDGGLRVIGLGLPASWLRTIAIALGAAALRILMGEFIIDPLTARFWPRAVAPAGAGSITGNWKIALLALAIV